MKTKQQLLKHLETEVYCRLKQSKHGVGVFAIRDIPKGVEPFKGMKYYHTISFEKKELSHLHPEIKKMIHDYSANINGHYHISTGGFNNINIEFFVNHSDTPNMEYDEEGTLITLRDIKAGEELRTNYNTFNEPNTVDYKEF